MKSTQGISIMSAKIVIVLFHFLIILTMFASFSQATYGRRLIRTGKGLSYANIDLRYPDYIVDPLPECTDAGYFVHPRNCSWFYRCISVHPSIKIYRREYFVCPPGLVYFEKPGLCSWRNSYAGECGDSTTDTATTTKPAITTEAPEVITKPIYSPPPIITITPDTDPPIVTNPPPPPQPIPEPDTCSDSYTGCEMRNVCDHAGEKTYTKYICSQAHSVCGNEKKSLCFNEKYYFYDFMTKQCFLPNLCPLQSFSAELSGAESKEPGTSSFTIGSPVSSLIPDIISVGIESELPVIETSLSEISIGTSGGISVPDSCAISQFQCSLHETCDFKNLKSNLYLCAQAHLKCDGVAEPKPLCQAGNPYNPKSSHCVRQVCPLISYKITVTESSTSTIQSSSSSFNQSSSYISSGVGAHAGLEASSSSSGQTSGSSSASNYFGSNLETAVSIDGVEIKKCSSTFSQCKLLNICDNNRNENKRYLCSNALLICNDISKNLCKDSALYDPINNECVSQLCPIIFYIVSVSEAGTGVNTPTVSGTSSPIVSEVEVGKVTSTDNAKCSSSFSKCKMYDVCNDVSGQNRRYLCANAHMECSKGEQINLCQNSHLYDPRVNICVSQLCPFAQYEVTVSVTAEGTISESTSSIISSVATGQAGQVIESQTGSSPSTGNEGEGSPGSQIDGTSEILKCSLSFSQCKMNEICDLSGVKKDKYLCSRVYKKCGSGVEENLCIGNLYNPLTNECITQSCPLISFIVNISESGSSTSVDLTNLGTVSVTTNVVPSVDLNMITETSNIGLVTETTPKVTASIITESGDILTIPHQCSTSYSKCKMHPICDNEGFERRIYLCSEAYLDCDSGKQISLCKNLNLYNPISNECISQLCPLIATITASSESAAIIDLSPETTADSSIPIDGGTGSTTVTSDLTTVSGSSVEIVESPSELSSNDSNTVDSSIGVENLLSKKCSASFSQCKTYEICDFNKVTNQRYLCAKADLLCSNELPTALCQVGSFFDPRTSECISRLCPLISYIVSTSESGSSGVGSESISSVSSGEENALGSSSTVDTSGTASESEISTAPTNISSSAETENIIDTSTSTADVENVKITPCSASFSQCRTYEVCDSNSVKSQRYLCAKADQLCPNKLSSALCRDGSHFDPRTSECIQSLCPLISHIVSIFESNTGGSSGTVSESISSVSSGVETVSGTTSIAESSGATSESEIPSGSTGISSGTETSENIVDASISTVDVGNIESKQCSASFTQCKTYEVCDLNDLKSQRYLCAKAELLCPNNLPSALCQVGGYFDPRTSECISRLCPLISYIVSTLESGTGGSSGVGSESISSVTSGEENVAGSSSIVDTSGTSLGSETSSSSANISSGIETSENIIGTSISTVDVDNDKNKPCSASFSQCKTYEICDFNAVKSQRYLCAKADQLCPNILPSALCQAGNYFDPRTSECIRSLCPLISYTVSIFESSIGGSSGTVDESISSVSSGVDIVSGSSSAAGTSGATSESEISSGSTGVSSGTETSENIVDASISTVALVNGDSNQCSASFSSCKTYDVCDFKGATDQRYLCANADLVCPNKLTKTLCPVGSFFDPKTNECVRRLCPLISYTVSTSGGSTSGSESTSSVTSEVENIEGSISTAETSNITSASEIPSISTSIDAATGISEGSVDAGVSLVESGYMESKKCSTSFTKCKMHDVCDDLNIFNKMYLCASAYLICDDETQKSLCEDVDLYNPAGDECVSKLCPFSSSKVIVSESSSTQSEISSSTINETTISSGSTSSISESSSISVGSSIATIVDESTTNKSTAISSVGCSSSFSDCSFMNVCSDTETTTRLYLCRSAYSDCSSGEEKVPLCPNSSFFDPTNENCVVQLCPMITSPVLENMSTVSETSEGLTTKAPQIYPPPSVIEEIDPLNSENYTKTVSCRISYSACYRINGCSLFQRANNFKVLCEATERCFFRGAMISENLLCEENLLYEIFGKKCIDRKDVSTCTRTMTSPDAFPTEGRSNIKSANDQIYSNLIDDLSQPDKDTSSKIDNKNKLLLIPSDYPPSDQKLASVDEKIMNITQFFKLTHPDGESDQSEVEENEIEYNLCKVAGDIPRLSFIEKNYCAKIGLCTDETGELLVRSINPLCSQYFQCTMTSYGLRLNSMKCPKGKLFSYQKSKCMAEPTVIGKCSLFYQGSPLSLQVKKYSEKLRKLIETNRNKANRISFKRHIITPETDLLKSKNDDESLIVRLQR